MKGTVVVFLRGSHSSSVAAAASQASVFNAHRALQEDENERGTIGPVLYGVAIIMGLGLLFNLYCFLRRLWYVYKCCGVDPAELAEEVEESATSVVQHQSHAPGPILNLTGTLRRAVLEAIFSGPESRKAATELDVIPKKRSQNENLPRNVEIPNIPSMGSDTKTSTDKSSRRDEYLTEKSDTTFGDEDIADDQLDDLSDFSDEDSIDNPLSSSEPGDLHNPGGSPRLSPILGLNDAENFIVPEENYIMELEGVEDNLEGEPQVDVECGEHQVGVPETEASPSLLHSEHFLSVPSFDGSIPDEEDYTPSPTAASSTPVSTPLDPERPTSETTISPEAFQAKTPIRGNTAEVEMLTGSDDPMLPNFGDSGASLYFPAPLSLPMRRTASVTIPEDCVLEEARDTLGEDDEGSSIATDLAGASLSSSLVMPMTLKRRGSFTTVTSEKTDADSTTTDGASVCPICLGRYKKGDMLILSQHCTHLFHKDCIFEWLESHDDCPMCRSAMVTDSEVSKAATSLVRTTSIPSTGASPSQQVPPTVQSSPTTSRTSPSGSQTSPNFRLGTYRPSLGWSPLLSLP
jgi:hypothetical protein